MASTLHFAGLALEADWIEAWGTWVGGLATTGTLIYAIVALHREAERRRADIKALREAEKEGRNAQARTIVIHSVRAGYGDESNNMMQYSAEVGNYGESPITNVIATLTYLRNKKRVAVELLPGRESPWRPVIPAQSTENLVWSMPWKFDGFPDGVGWRNTKDFFTATVQFTDVHGDRWVVSNGKGEQPSRVYDSGS